MLKDELIKWTRDYLNSFGGKTKAVIGISGGKDSTIILKLLIEAVGKDRIYAVTIPSYQGIDEAVYKIAKEFKIKIHTVSITNTYTDLTTNILRDTIHENDREYDLNNVYKSNTPARLRMVTLYGIAALLGDARVVCTSNRSEDYIGWATKFGDMAGDFAPIADLTVREVKILGYQLGISSDLIEKKPDDGMCGKTDEDKFGFTYNELDEYLLYGIEGPNYKKIEKMHKNTLHKFLPMPKFIFEEDKIFTKKINYDIDRNTGESKNKLVDDLEEVKPIKKKRK